MTVFLKTDGAAVFGKPDALGLDVDDVRPRFYAFDPAYAGLLEQVRRVAAQDSTLLLTGETGTGKTALARLVHALSPRRNEPFLTLDCGALSASLIESEMFGHVQGAFTGADSDRAGKFSAAGRGTLLLDEISALPLSLQSKLLRVVDEQAFEPVGSNRAQTLQVRLVVVSNTPLDLEVRLGRFRAELYYRLNVISFHLPPLRERPRMIVPLALRFLGEFAERHRRDIRGARRETLRLLEEYAWPGNIRELRTVIERAVALAPGPDIEIADLPQAITGAKRPPLRPLTVPATLKQSWQTNEIQRILEALRKHQNNRLRAAADLGISRTSLYKKLRKYGLLKPISQAF